MGLFDRVERKLDRVINGAFARAFKAEVQPVEIAAEMRRAMDERAAVVGKGRTIVPNSFVIELDPDDHDRLTQYEDVLVDELIASVSEHAESQRYRPGGPFAVEFVVDDSLDTGVFRVRSRTRQDVPPSRERRADAPPAPRRPARPAAAEPRGRESARYEDPAPSSPRPRNLPYPPEATAAAEGDVATAGKAASAAAGAAAGTAAAGRAGRVWDDEDARPTSAPRDDRHRQELLDAWDDDEDDTTSTAYSAAPVDAAARPVDAAARPWLDVAGDAYPLLGAITIIGRDPEADITLDDSGISRRHCEIRVTHDGPHLVIGLRDLGSTNGTFVNGDRVASSRLREGDRVTIGRIGLDVRTRGR